MGIKIGNVEYSEEQVKELLLQMALKHDPGSTTLTATPLNGPFPGNNAQYGVFSAPGVRPERFNATPRVRSLASGLQFRQSEYLNELLEIKTGVTAGSGNNATSFCGDPAVFGQLKTMRMAYTFGEIHFKTKLADITQVGLLRDRADVSGQMYNNAAIDNPFLPQVPGVTGITDSRSLLQSEFYTAGVGVERSVSQVNWRGVAGTQANTYRGIQKEWNGLDQLIKIGYVDHANQNVLTPAADSVVQSFNTNITGTDSNGLDFVEAMHDLYYALKQRASQVGMEGTQWALVMREEHFRRAVDVWACAYATYRCTNGTAGQPVTTEGTQVQALRIQMQRGQYLLFDGEEVPVIVDDGILIETVANNTYKSDAYFIPLSWGGIPLTYFQFFNMGNSYAQEFASFTGDETRVINGGLYRVAKRTTGFCLEYLFAARVRIVLETPFLAGRLDDTQYTYFAQTRQPYPGDSLYANGGVTYRS